MDQTLSKESSREETKIDDEPFEENQAANLIFEIPEIISEYNRGKLFLGGREAASDIQFLTLNHIRAVLTMAQSAFISYDDNLQIDHKCIDAQDTTNYNILQDFEESYNFIEKNINCTNLLVHCEKGISRSPTIVIAYLMKKQNKILSDVFSNVRLKRKEVKPNGGFYFYLDKYNESLRKQYNQEFDLNQKNKNKEKKLLNLPKSEIVEQLMHE